VKGNLEHEIKTKLILQKFNKFKIFVFKM
jgi:hypothetical protein